MENSETKTVETQNTEVEILAGPEIIAETENSRSRTAGGKTVSIDKIKKILPFMIAVILGLCLFMAFSGSTTKYVPYDFNLDAYGESLNGYTSEMLKDCTFKVNYDKSKIVMKKAGKTYTGKIDLLRYSSDTDGFIYSIEWKKAPDIVADFKTDTTSGMLRTVSDGELTIAFYLDGRIKGTPVELTAFYYCDDL